MRFWRKATMSRWELGDSFQPNIWGSMTIHLVVAVKGRKKVMLANAGSPESRNYPERLREAREIAKPKLDALNEE